MKATLYLLVALLVLLVSFFSYSGLAGYSVREGTLLRNDAERLDTWKWDTSLFRDRAPHIYEMRTNAGEPFTTTIFPVFQLTRQSQRPTQRDLSASLDLNKDGVVDELDYTACTLLYRRSYSGGPASQLDAVDIRKYYSSTGIDPEIAFTACDLNSDGEIGYRDLLQFYQAIRNIGLGNDQRQRIATQSNCASSEEGRTVRANYGQLCTCVRDDRDTNYFYYMCEEPEAGYYAVPGGFLPDNVVIPLSTQ